MHRTSQQRVRRPRPLVVLAVLLVTVGVIATQNTRIVSGIPAASQQLEEVRNDALAAYEHESDRAHRVWLSPDPTQVPIPIKRPGFILPLNAGKLRHARAVVPSLCMLDVSGAIKKLGPDNQGHIAVEYQNASAAVLLNQQACADGSVTLLDRKTLNALIGAETLR